jgi:hypothetical protein
MCCAICRSRSRIVSSSGLLSSHQMSHHSSSLLDLCKCQRKRAATYSSYLGRITFSNGLVRAAISYYHHSSTYHKIASSSHQLIFSFGGRRGESESYNVHIIHRSRACITGALFIVLRLNRSVTCMQRIKQPDTFTTTSQPSPTPQTYRNEQQSAIRSAGHRDGRRPAIARVDARHRIRAGSNRGVRGVAGAEQAVAQSAGQKQGQAVACGGRGRHEHAAWSVGRPVVVITTHHRHQM